MFFVVHFSESIYEGNEGRELFFNFSFNVKFIVTANVGLIEIKKKGIVIEKNYEGKIILIQEYS